MEYCRKLIPGAPGPGSAAIGVLDRAWDWDWMKFDLRWDQPRCIQEIGE